MTTETPELIDALPYIDTAIDESDEQRALVMKEIDDEIDKFPPTKDYLEYLPCLDRRPFFTELLEAEISAIEAGSKRTPTASELASLKVEPPVPIGANIDSDKISTELWQQSLNQIKIKMEYLQRQSANLQSLSASGALEWQQFVEANRNIEEALRKGIEDFDKRTQEVNWTRKTEHEKAGRTILVLKNELNAYIDKNRLLTNEVRKLERSLT